MESLIGGFVQFLCVIVNFCVWGGDGGGSTGQWVMPRINFDIFLKFPHFVSPKVLGRSATHEATRKFNLW